jgi:carbamoyl-phosphate synthase large subunit
LKILITNSGRRTYFIDFINDLRLKNLEIFISDTNKYVPTAAKVKKKNFLLLPPSSRKVLYQKKLKKFILKKKIDLVIPLSDYDLNILSNLKNKLIRKTKFLISSTKVINICLNKIKTNNFLISNKFDTPKIFKKKKQIIKFPVVLKTVDGNGSKDLQIIKNKIDLKKIKMKNFFFYQEYIKGTEYNIDILNNKNKDFISCSIKKKILMRAGETDRCEIVSNKKIFELAKKLSIKLGHVGNLDVDLIFDGKKNYIIDLNPRFGGGYPFTHLSGHNYIKYLIKNFFYRRVSYKNIRQNFGFYSKGINIYKLNEK